MSATVQTRTEDRCALTGCGTHRRDAMTHGRRWHVVDGLVYASERQCLVRHSWADACAAHAEQIAAAVTEDLAGWAERWTVTIRTHNYATKEDEPEQLHASADGTPAAWLRF